MSTSSSWNADLELCFLTAPSVVLASILFFVDLYVHGDHPNKMRFCAQEAAELAAAILSVAP